MLRILLFIYFYWCLSDMYSSKDLINLEYIVLDELLENNKIFVCTGNFMSKLHILTMESICCWRLLFLIFLSAYTDHVFCLVFCFLLYCFIIRQVMQLINLFSKKLDFRNRLMNVNSTIFVIDTNICQHFFIINLQQKFANCLI